MGDSSGRGRKEGRRKREGRGQRVQVGSSRVTGGERQLVPFGSGVLQVKSCGTPFVRLSPPPCFPPPVLFSLAAFPHLCRSHLFACRVCRLVLRLWCFVPPFKHFISCTSACHSRRLIQEWCEILCPVQPSGSACCAGEGKGCVCLEFRTRHAYWPSLQGLG